MFSHSDGTTGWLYIDILRQKNPFVKSLSPSLGKRDRYSGLSAIQLGLGNTTLATASVLRPLIRRCSGHGKLLGKLVWTIPVIDISRPIYL